LRDQDRRESVRDTRKKADAAHAIRMHGRISEWQPRCLPEEAHPDQQAEVPSQQNELKQRQAEEEIPPPSELRPQTARRYCADGLAAAGGCVTNVAFKSCNRRLNSGESMMMVPPAARSRSTASGSSTNVVGCRFRYSSSFLSFNAENETSIAYISAAGTR
jgi:hypothetical protein